MQNKIRAALDIVHEVAALDIAATDFSGGFKAKKRVKEALELDPDCIEAYEMLAGLEISPVQIQNHLNKGIAIGRKKFGGIFLEENKGIFWIIKETRPFMRCLYKLAYMPVMKMKFFIQSAMKQRQKYT